MDYQSLYLYNIPIIFSLFLYFITKNKILILIPLFLFSSLRYLVGNDYEGYIHIFYNIRNYGFSYVEPAYLLLNYLFSFSPIGYIPVLAISSLVTYTILIITFKRYSILGLGIVFIFTSDFIFLMHDQVRQAIAISIFLYSIRFVIEGKFIKYCICIIVASLFHFTALILFPVYYVNRFNINSYIWVLIILVMYMFYIMGLFSGISLKIIGLVPYYGDRIISRAYLLNVQQTSTGLGVLFWTLTGVLAAIFRYRFEDKTIINIYLFGIVFYLFTLDFLPTSRIAHYLTYSKMILFPILIKKLDRLSNKLTMTTLFLLYFKICLLFNLGKHGGFPYQTFLFERKITDRVR